MKMQVDITMVAVLRPSIVERTISDIMEKIVKTNRNIDFRLIINVDPVGEKRVEQNRIFKVAKTFFALDKITCNMPGTPSFPKAVKWVWGQATSPYIFHIEDDWSINRTVDVNKMIGILDKYPKLSSLRLYKYSTPKATTIHTFSCKWDYNEEGFYLSRDWRKQFGLNPILIKKEFIDQALPRMKDEYNPEKQFRYSQEYMRKIIKDWQYGLFCNPGERALVSDIGTKWRKETKFVKARNFISWEKQQ